MLTVISSFPSANSQMGKLELLIIEDVAIHGSWSHNSFKDCLDSRSLQTGPGQMPLRLSAAVGKESEERCALRPPAPMRNLCVGGLALAGREEGKGIARKCGVRLWH